MAEASPLEQPTVDDDENPLWYYCTDPAELRKWRGLAKGQHTKIIHALDAAIEQRDDAAVANERRRLMNAYEEVDARHQRLLKNAVFSPSAGSFETQWLEDVGQQYADAMQ